MNADPLKYGFRYDPMQWVESGNLAKAARIKFAEPVLDESVNFLEEFVCYHLGKQPRSLKFLRQIRKGS